MSVDLYLLKLINGTWYNPALDPFFRLVSNWEKLQPYAMATLALTAFFVSKRWKYVLLLTFFSIVFADLLANDLKVAVGRQRPYTEIEIRKANKYRYAGQSSSMPSNHAANLFAAAFLPAWFLLRRKKQKWAAALPFIPALMVGYSRVYLGVHYPSDVLVGYLVGVCSAGIVLSLDCYLPICKFDGEGQYAGFSWAGCSGLLFALITVYRFSTIARGVFPLAPSEALAFENSRSPGWPTSAPLTYLFTSVLGGTPFAVKLVGFTLTSLVIFAVSLLASTVMKMQRLTAAGLFLLLIVLPVYNEPSIFPALIQKAEKKKMALKPESDPNFASIGYDKLGKLITSSRNAMPNPEKVLVIGCMPEIAHEAGMYVEGQPRTFAIDIQEKNAIFVSLKRMTEVDHTGWDAICVFPGMLMQIPATLTESFESVDRPELLVIENRFVVYKQFTLFKCYGLKEKKP